jgi:protein associated with RNAse G/E
LSEIIVYKLDERGHHVWQYPAVVLEQQPHLVRLEAFFNREDLDLGFVRFKRGDRFLETFYNDRWYNVFAIYDRDNKQLKGWYCNICRPAEITATAVRCEDLALDVWVTPDQDPQILDREEFAALPITGQERQQCWRAVQEIKRLARDGELPH